MTGVSWVDGELWHGTGSDPNGAPAEVRRIDPETGAVEARLVLPAGTFVSGLEGAGAVHHLDVPLVERQYPTPGVEAPVNGTGEPLAVAGPQSIACRPRQLR